MRQSAWFLAALFLATGCSAPDISSPSDEPSAEPHTVEGSAAPYTPDLTGVSAEQAAELGDGEVTTDEYSAGFRRFEACLSAAGYQLRDVVVAPSGYISAGIPDAAVSSGVERECYALEWMQTDIIWQLAHPDDSPSNQFRRDCLIQNGIQPGETAEEIQLQWDEANLDPDNCEG